TSFGSLAEVISAAKSSEKGAKEPDRFAAPPLPSPGDIRGYLLAVRQKVIAGLPHIAEEIAAWWDEIGELMRRKKQGGTVRQCQGIQKVLETLDVTTKFQSWDIKIAAGLMAEIPDGSLFNNELAAEYRAVMEKGGVHRGRPLFARIMYRYEDSDKGTCINSWERLMNLTLKDDVIVRFRGDFVEIWSHLDVGFKASMGKRVVRDLVYNKLKGSNKLRDTIKAYEKVNIRDTPMKYRRVRTLAYLWKAISRWEEDNRRDRNDSALMRDRKAGAPGFYNDKSRKPSAPAHIVGDTQKKRKPKGGKGQGQG
ncbi:hypothetical protein N9L68_01240, partial [bacterium]|nr:hypothetical protein [bacterium]